MEVPKNPQEIIDAYMKLQQKDQERKLKLSNRVKRWIQNHPDLYAERRQIYNENRNEARRLKREMARST